MITAAQVRVWSERLRQHTRNLCVPQGKLVHAQIIQSGCVPNTHLCKLLLNFYSKGRRPHDASHVFEQMPQQDSLSWTSVISAHASANNLIQALRLFCRMLDCNGIRPNQYTYSAVIPVCTKLENWWLGFCIHARAVAGGFMSDSFVRNALMDLYGKSDVVEGAERLFHEEFELGFGRDVVLWNTMISCYARAGLMEQASGLFHRIPAANMVSWNSMIVGFAQNGDNLKALHMFREMVLLCPWPDAVTLTSVISLIAGLGNLKLGMEIHGRVVRSGLRLDSFMQSALLDMYSKCGRLEDAKRMFHKIEENSKGDVVLWNTILAGYAQNGDIDNAVKVFQQIPHRDISSWNSMISAYVQNGHINKACELFEKMPQKTTVAWNTLIAFFSREGPCEKALSLYHRMKKSGACCDKYTYTSLLPACTKMAVLEEGTLIHEEIKRQGFEKDVFVSNALLDMYAKCGSMERAMELFERMGESHRNVVSWTTVIAGFAMKGCAREALQVFEQMQAARVEPNHVTLVSVLYACCHSGFVEEGFRYFAFMSSHYGITPTMEHYGCMVDLLGRAKKLDEAMDFIRAMPINPDATVLGSLLNSCKLCNE